MRKKEVDIKNEDSEIMEEDQIIEFQSNSEDVSTIIKFDHVTKSYKDDSLVLADIDFEIRSGEFVSIVGHSGAGKSTLLKLIYAEESPTKGTIYFSGEPLHKISRRKLPYHRRRIGTIFQDFKLLPQKTVFENVAYALEVCGSSMQEIREDVPQILDIVGLSDKAKKFPHEISGGEQQKVVLARAFIHKPSLIIADEPTGNLDPESSVEIMKLLLKINEIGTTVILASHNKDIVNKINKRVIVLNKGKIICDDIRGKYRMC